MNSKVIDSIFESMLGRLISVVFIHFQNNDINFTTTCMKIESKVWVDPARHNSIKVAKQSTKSFEKNDNSDKKIRRQWERQYLVTFLFNPSSNQQFYFQSECQLKQCRLYLIFIFWVVNYGLNSFYNLSSMLFDLHNGNFVLQIKLT